ncbi:MAG: GNAT family N-acetyltransferase [Firmicutes bacterium]|nr:GNAT family N-acetyltransferase [Bacillota bacterium]
MEFIKLETLTLHIFDKNSEMDILFYKKLRNDKTITKYIQGLSVGLLYNPQHKFFNKSFFVAEQDSYIGYIKIGNYNELNKYVYLSGAIDFDSRGKSLGSKMLYEVSDYIFKNYPEVESIRLKIKSTNKSSIYTANSCGFIWLTDELYYKLNPYLEKTFTKILK